MYRAIFLMMLLLSRPAWAQYDGLLGVTEINEIISHIGKIDYHCKNYVFEKMFNKLFSPYDINNIKISIKDNNQYEMFFEAEGYKIKAKGRFKHSGRALVVTVEKAILRNFFSMDVTEKVIDCFRDGDDGRFVLNNKDDIVIKLDSVQGR